MNKIVTISLTVTNDDLGMRASVFIHRTNGLREYSATPFSRNNDVATLIQRGQNFQLALAERAVEVG